MTSETRSEDKTEMARGFRSIDEELGWVPVDGDIGDFIQIDYGTGTGWLLLCEFSRKSSAVWIIVNNPISYRVHDERELISYWAQRSDENVPYAFAYEIEESAYLDEIRTGLSGLINTSLRHFLMGGQNICVEFIASIIPTISLAAPDLARKNR